MAVWRDGIVGEHVWPNQTKRLLIVCPEPNEEWMQHTRDSRRDMRELLRNPESERKPFYGRIRQAIRAFHHLASRLDRGGVQDHDNLIRKIAFVPSGGRQTLAGAL